MVVAMVLLALFFISSSRWILQGSLGLRITGLSVPSQVQLGSDVFLQCHFDLEGSNLYALKWYKGQHEFYRFILKEVPPVQIFPWGDIVINSHSEEEDEWSRLRTSSASLLSTAGQVLLRNVTSAAEGVYKCEVSTEAPIFDTDYKESNLSFIVVTNDTPTISWLNRPEGSGAASDWKLGDVIHLKCYMNGTRPASRLSWYLNGQPAPSGFVESSTPELISGGYYNAQLGLRLPLLPEYFVLGQEPSAQQLELSCLSLVGTEDPSMHQSRAKWLISHHQPPVLLDPPGTNQTTSDDAQSQQSDSDSPSRRTQPVVGSYPGRPPGKTNNNGDSSSSSSGGGNGASSLAAGRTGPFVFILAGLLLTCASLCVRDFL